MIALGCNVHIFARPYRREELARCFEALAGGSPVRTVEFPGIDEPMLNRSGWPAEALAAYERARRIIAAETGLDPGPVLSDLQQAILAGDGAELPGVPARQPEQGSAEAARLAS
jgi:hypothetical protein